MATAVKTTKTTTCTSLVKGPDYQPNFCEIKLSNGDCPERQFHILKFQTGFCSNGACEGKKKLSHTGVAMRTCAWWRTCPCQCHRTYDTMFAQAGMDRIVVDNSGYRPVKSPYWMPSPQERMEMLALSNSNRDDTPRIIESPLPDVVPITLARDYSPTATGRSARGQLESWVKKHCDIWLVEEYMFACTPVYLAKEIGKEEGIAPPSVGAIGAVFDRWTKINFAVTARKPVRFERYTEQGVKLGLEGCKYKDKMSKRSQEASSARRIGRP